MTFSQGQNKTNLNFCGPIIVDILHVRLVSLVSFSKRMEPPGFILFNGAPCMANNLTVQVRYGGILYSQPLAKSKGVHREVESEGSWRQSSDPRYTNIIRHIRWDEFALQNEIQKLHRRRSVNDAGTWNEGYSTFRGRSHRRVKTKL